MPQDKNYLVEPSDFSLDEKQAAVVAALDENQLKFAAALAWRQLTHESAKAACQVLLDGKQDLLDRMSDADYAKIAWLYEQDAREPDTAQMSEACETVLDDKFGRAWLE